MLDTVEILRKKQGYSGYIHLKTQSPYKSFGLKRVFYSVFRPVADTPLADKPAASIPKTLFFCLLVVMLLFV
ncbi:hypothetical protein KKD62_01055 [Patescibacteria group bacterium]|nr:hypothetical protein [Patescibacteria group bacterium]MBU1931265.1 hypothetical protein [Patescibacteria group bacterium]